MYKDSDLATGIVGNMLEFFEDARIEAPGTHTQYLENVLGLSGNLKGGRSSWAQKLLSWRKNKIDINGRKMMFWKFMRPGQRDLSIVESLLLRTIYLMFIYFDG